MTNPQKKLVRVAAMAATAVALLIPVTVSPGQGIEGNEACADGACCRELMSVCVKDGQASNHYYEPASGVCTSVEM